MNLIEAQPSAVRRRRAWTPLVVPLGIALVLLGAWAALAPLTGPYFGYGFDTSTAWLASTRQWELDLGPGVLAMVAGLLMLIPLRAPAWLAGLLAAVAGVWLLVGPSLYPLWASPIFPTGSTELRMFKWIGYFYGTGALITYFAAIAQGMLSRSVGYEAAAAPTIGRPPAPAEDVPIRRAS